MPGIDRFLSRLGTFGFSQAPQRVDLPRGVNIHKIQIRLTANVTVAGGAADGALVTEGIQRFLQRVRVLHDGVELVQPLDGRQLFQINARTVAQIIGATNLAIPGVQAATAVAMDASIPFSRDYLANPIDTVLPGTLPVRQELALFFEFNQARSNAASDLGTGAFIAGGDRTVTFTNIALTFETIYSTTRYSPLYIPLILTRTTEQLAAANTEVPLVVTEMQPYDSVLLRYLQNANQDVQEAFNFVTFQGGGGSVRYIDRADSVMLQRADAGLFPAAITAGQVGTIFIRHADNGKLGSVVVPSRMPDPRYTFDVDAPGVAPGFIQATFMALMKRPGVTRDL